MLRAQAIVPVVSCTLTLASTARADGVNVAWYLSRVPGWHTAPERAVLLVIALMAINYLLNLVVIGWPSVKMGASFHRVARDLVPFTLLGQVADRFGAIAGPVVADLVLGFTTVAGSRGIGLVFSVGIAMNFVLSAVTIAFLVRYFMRRRWSLSGRPVRLVAIAASVITNPTWAIWAGAQLPDPFV